MERYKLICMSFDGEYITEAKGSDISELWDHANDMGSRWFFYPFSFVCTDKTVVDTPNGLTMLANKRIKTVQRMFKTLSETEEMQGADCDDFVFCLAHGTI